MEMEKKRTTPLALVLPSLLRQRQPLQRHPRLPRGEVPQVEVVRRQVHQPLPANVGERPHVVPRGLHELVVEDPLGLVRERRRGVQRDELVVFHGLVLLPAFSRGLVGHLSSGGNAMSCVRKDNRE